MVMNELSIGVQVCSGMALRIVARRQEWAADLEAGRSEKGIEGRIVCWNMPSAMDKDYQGFAGRCHGWLLRLLVSIKRIQGKIGIAEEAGEALYTITDQTP